jgi:hypothetical protein
LEQHKPTGHVLVVGSPVGYRLMERDGPAPGCDAAVEVDGRPYGVLRLGPSPLPGDRRRCVFLETQDPPPPQRTRDA